jgi:mRNA interferase RelE/StbE
LAYNVVYKGSVKRDLKRVAKAEARRLLNRIEKDLSKKPNAYPPPKGELAGLRKYGVGDYRVVFAVLDTDVVALRIAHRKNVYR